MTTHASAVRPETARETLKGGRDSVAGVRGTGSAAFFTIAFLKIYTKRRSQRMILYFYKNLYMYLTYMYISYIYMYVYVYICIYMKKEVAMK